VDLCFAYEPERFGLLAPECRHKRNSRASNRLTAAIQVLAIVRRNGSEMLRSSTRVGAIPPRGPEPAERRPSTIQPRCPPVTDAVGRAASSEKSPVGRIAAQGRELAHVSAGIAWS
jgi:hypothetical protein